ncbi:replication-relaxation family protein [Nocardia sp. NPDC059240]|uniref:replication-relaxation family protein n=1 Tax=Nocardia sp. NPDC059240 TaxID=3346786 RepID=UPI0036B38F1C
MNTSPRTPRRNVHALRQLVAHSILAWLSGRNTHAGSLGYAEPAAAPAWTPTSPARVPRDQSAAPETDEHRSRSFTLADAIDVQERLTARDHELIGLLARHRVLTTQHIANLLFADDREASKRLRVLTELGILERFHHGRSPGHGRGQLPWHYTLGPLGAMITAASTETAIPTASDTRARAQRLAHSGGLDHLLGVNDFFARLARTARTSSGCALSAWRDSRAAALMCGNHARPDGYGQWRERGRGTEFFLEYDDATNALAVTLSKLRGYRYLAHIGRGLPVLFVFTDPARRHAFGQGLANRPELAAGLLVATAATGDIHEHGPAAPIWRTGTDTTPQPLIALAPAPTANPAAPIESTSRSPRPTSEEL